MPQSQKESENNARLLSFDELQDNLRSVLLHQALMGQPFVVDMPGFQPICFHSVQYHPIKKDKREIKSGPVATTNRLKAVEKPDRATMSEEEYEEKHKAWRKHIILSSAGAIKDTKTLDRELKETRAIELKTARKMGRW